MTDWRRAIAQIASNVEGHFDALKQRLDRRLGDEPIQIIAYHGYGTPEQVYLRGRVLEASRVRPAGDNDSLWDNLVNMYRRFESDEVGGARVLAEFQGQAHELVSDEEGFFELRAALAQPLPADRLWHEVALTLLAPQPPAHAPARAVGRVLAPQPGARFGVISDIDDTVVRTDVTDLLRMARTVFLGNARTRLPFPGVAALYRALHRGAEGAPANPLFYVSSSPWNVYDLLIDFFGLHDIPAGPMLLRDWGVARGETLPTNNRAHKLAIICDILDRFPRLPFLLIGDSGQEDPEIYHEVLGRYPQRILAIYIRNVSGGGERADAIRALAGQVVAAGATLILADDTLAMARHAAERGWIAPEHLSEVAADKAADETRPGPPDAPEPAPTATVVIPSAEDRRAASNRL